MPETLPVITDLQQALPSDITKGFREIRSSLSNVVRDAVEPGLAWEGFTMAANIGDTQITVGTGRFYKNGDVYGRYETQVLDILDDLPPYDQQILAICAGGRVAPVIEGRAFLRSTERNPDGSRNVYQRDTQTEEVYLAELSIVPGDIAATAKPPASVGNDRVVVAYALVSPAGLISITPVVANRVTNARRQRVELLRLSTVVDGYAPRLASLGSALTGLADEVSGKATNAETRRIKVALARIQEVLNIPDVRTDYGGDHFLDDDESDKTFAAYDARVEEGLRFAAAATITAEIKPLSDLDTSIRRSGTLILPDYTERRTRVAQGNSGIIQLNSFAIDLHTIVKAEMSRQRFRFGAAYELSSSAEFWNTGKFTAGNGPFQIFTRNGESYQVYDTGREDAEGHQIKRLRRTWLDTVTGETYTSRLTSSHTLTGYDWVQTFQQPEDAIVVGLGPHIAKLPAAGGMTIGLCDTTEAGAPDTKRMLTFKEVALKDGQGRLNWALAPGASMQSITPTLLSKGSNVGFYLSTPADYWLYIADLEVYRDGTLFYRPTPIVFQADPSKAIMFDQSVADFVRPRTELQLKPLNLVGGFNSIDVLAKLITPAGTRAVFEVEEGGQYRQLGNGATLAGTPETLGWRLVFTGTSQLQAMLDLADATVTLSRPKTAFKHVSTERTTPAAVRSVFLSATMENFNSAKHTCTLKLFANNGEVAPVAVVDEPDPADPKRIVRTATFTFSAPGITKFRRIVQGTTTDTGDLFHVAEVIDVTQAT